MTVSLQTLIDRSTRNMGAVQSFVKALALEMIRRAYSEGILVQISSGYRSNAEQQRLYNQGRTTAGNVVTNAKPGQSVHNYGLAIDYFLVSDDGNTALWTVNAKWRRVAAIGKSLGFSWGGDWTSFKDYPHLEYTKGLTWRDLQAGKRPTPPSTIPTSPTGLLELGAKGDKVKQLQNDLIALGYNLGKFGADGDFGQATKNAVMNFQREYGLSVDGIAGDKTLAKIKGVKEMLQKEINELKKTIAALQNKVTQLEKKPPTSASDWAHKDWQEASKNGYFDFRRPQDTLTRQEAAIVINRLRHNFLELIKENKDKIEALETENEEPEEE